MAMGAGQYRPSHPRRCRAVTEALRFWALIEVIGLGAAPLRVAPPDSKRAQTVVLEEAELVTAKRTGVGRAVDAIAKGDSEPRGAEAPFRDPQPRLSVRRSEGPAGKPSCGDPAAQEEHGGLLSPAHVGADVQLRERQDRHAAETASANVEGDEGDEEAAVHL